MPGVLPASRITVPYRPRPWVRQDDIGVKAVSPGGKQLEEAGYRTREMRADFL